MLDPGAGFQVEATSRPEHSRIASHRMASPSQLGYVECLSRRMPRGQEHVTAETTVAQLKGRITSEVPCDQPVIRLCPEFVELLEIDCGYMWLYYVYKWTIGFGWIWIMISEHNND